MDFKKDWIQTCCAKIFRLFIDVVVPDQLLGCALDISCLKFHVTRMSVRLSKTSILHLLQSWIFGGKVDPDPLSGCRLCPIDIMFQISGFYDIMKVIKDIPILYLSPDLDSWTLFLDVSPRDVIFQISGFYDVWKVIKDTTIHHLQG